MVYALRLTLEAVLGFIFGWAARRLFPSLRIGQGAAHDPLPNSHLLVATGALKDQRAWRVGARP